MDNLEKKINKLRNLKQNKDKTNDELVVLAKEEIEKKDVISSLTFCKDDKEREFAIDLLERYTKENSIESEADKDTLRQLIDMEILAERFKYLLKIEYEKSNPAIPLNMVEELRETEKNILEIKTQLGLTNKNRDQAGWIETWEDLRKKAIKYYEEHRGFNTIKCPYCQNLFHLLMRADKHEPIKSSWFRGTILYNIEVFKLFDEKRINIEEAANIMGVSSYYIELIYNEIYLKEKNDRKN